ncbi:YdeI/OmpD-associated family protein [Aestuariispira ectoiniformans]|uniref:YdeI/OmpD-associated family protein n=1 Tax=Aestuariispira ectoiniformans TaxID=2775080 RepID=UPI00223B6B08|nr:YdeI/OmpD-associated family protein [Aestuariispira ectoiniformans]
MDVDHSKIRGFADRQAFHDWLAEHHADETELWVRIAKKGAEVRTATMADCIDVALAWGWIDGLKKGLDETAYLLRFTPRKLQSAWSKRNRDIAENLIAEGRMQPAGLVHVEAARADGRWDQAYAGQSNFEIPADFLDALAERPKAKETFDGLNRANLFAIYYRLHTAKKPETRTKRFNTLLDMLGRGEKIH